MMHLALALVIATGPIGAFEYRETSPASLFPFRPAAVDPSLPDAVPNPAYLPAIRYPYLHVAGSMPYTMDDLYASSIRAGYGARGFGIQAAWDRFGIPQYVEHAVELNIGYMPVKYISLGVGACYYNLSIDTPETNLRTHQADAHAAVVLAPCRWFEASFMQENIGSLFSKKRRDLLFPGWSAGAAVKPIRGLALLYNINSTPAGYVNSVSVSAWILKYFSLRAGYAFEATTCAAALSFLYRYIAVSYCIKYHPHLGITHSIGVTLAASEMRIEPISYGTLFPRGTDVRDTAKTDINACSYEDLSALPGLRGMFAERIMKYRKTIGPVTRTALVQIGMSEPEISRLLESAAGLAAEETSPADARRRRDAAEKEQKRIFASLVAAGVPAATALELSDLALKGGYEAVAARVSTLRELDRRKMREVLELCKGSR